MHTYQQDRNKSLPGTPETKKIQLLCSFNLIRKQQQRGMGGEGQGWASNPTAMETGLQFPLNSRTHANHWAKPENGRRKWHWRAFQRDCSPTHTPKFQVLLFLWAMSRSGSFGYSGSLFDGPRGAAAPFPRATSWLSEMTSFQSRFKKVKENLENEYKVLNEKTKCLIRRGLL